MEELVKRICPVCNYSGSGTDMICPYCGLRLISSCPVCDAPIRNAFARFCYSCGLAFRHHFINLRGDSRDLS